MAIRVASRPKKSSKNRPITGEALFAMGDIGPAELVEGEIIQRMPTGHPHGYIESLISAFIHLYLREHPIGRCLTGEVGLYTQRNPDTVRGADVVFISNERLKRAQPEGYLDVAPELVVEIMSPNDTWSEVHAKIGEYFTIDVQAVWVIDPYLEQIHIYHSPDNVTRLTSEDELTEGAILPGFQVPISELFNLD
jgi:Uma2 family endonuclease